MKTFEAIGKKEVLYKVTVTAKSKSEALKKIRSGDVDTEVVVRVPRYFKLGGGSSNATCVNEIKENQS